MRWMREEGAGRLLAERAGCREPNPSRSRPFGGLRGAKPVLARVSWGLAERGLDRMIPLSVGRKAQAIPVAVVIVEVSHDTRSWWAFTRKRHALPKG